MTKTAPLAGLLAAVSVLALLGACGQRQTSSGWTRFDLRKHRFHEEGLESRAIPLGRGIPTTRRTGYLAGRIRGLAGTVGSDYQWSVDLGDDPYFSFVPATHDVRGCRMWYRVRIVRDDGTRVEVHRQRVRQPAFFARPAVEIPLAAFARRRVGLVLSVDAEGPGCGAAEAVWGSPAVYSRRPVPAGVSHDRPDVILLGLDTTRADALGAYSALRPSPSPAIDRLAAESDVWLEAFSCFNVTNPSFASILTGLYGKNHGVYDLATPLPEEHATMAEIFRDAGYATAAIIAARHLGDSQSGLAQGFDNYHVPRQQLAAEVVVDEAIDWIAGRRIAGRRIAGREQPYFLWLHFFDPHTPHTPPRPFSLGWRPSRPGLGPVDRWTAFRRPGKVTYDAPGLGGHRDLYAGEVAYLDRQIGRLLDFLASRGSLERTVVALVADHGENLGEHGVDYRHSGLWDSTTRVPLMIRWPGRERRGRRLPGLAQTVDLFPTLLAAAGLEPPPGDGLDLRRERARRAVFAEASRGKGAMVRTPHHLFFQAFEGHAAFPAGPYLFDLTDDPAQERNLAGAGLEAEAELVGVLGRWLSDRRAEALPAVPLAEEQLDQLRALGYVDGP